MSFILPELPYAKDAFNGVLSAEAFDYHHGKHHAAYVNNLNNLVPGTEFEGMDLESIIKKSSAGVFNNSAQIWNHSFFWNCLSPNGGSAPTGAIAEAINADFGGFDAFKEAFTKAATTLFGSGWTWLVKTPAGKLEIVQTFNAGTPLTTENKPILTLDVWEHAYYIDYRNARPNFIAKYWDIINWDFANQNL